MHLISYVVLVAAVALAVLGVCRAEELAAAPPEDDARTRAGSLPVDPARPVCPIAPGQTTQPPAAVLPRAAAGGPYTNRTEAQTR